MPRDKELQLRVSVTSSVGTQRQLMISFCNMERDASDVLTRQAIYLYRNTEERSCNHYCSGKAINITYCECVSVSVVLVIQHAMRMRHIVLCALPASTLFFHIIS